MTRVSNPVLPQLPPEDSVVPCDPPSISKTCKVSKITFWWSFPAISKDLEFQFLASRNSKKNTHKSTTNPKDPFVKCILPNSAFTKSVSGTTISNTIWIHPVVTVKLYDSKPTCYQPRLLPETLRPTCKPTLLTPWTAAAQPAFVSQDGRLLFASMAGWFKGRLDGTCGAPVHVCVP